MGYSERFERALVYASQLHREQLRKGTQVPYVTHLLSVAALVGEAGASEDEVIAALLHDAAEDQGGEDVLATIRHTFGEVVEQIVASCSDTFETPKPPWLQRKRAYLAHLEEADISSLKVSCADKVHNARSIVADWHALGDEVWTRFRATKEQTLWYYEGCLKVMREREVPQRLVLALEEAVTGIRLAVHAGVSAMPPS